MRTVSRSHHTVQIHSRLSQLRHLHQGAGLPNPHYDSVIAVLLIDAALDEILPIGVIRDLPHQAAGDIQPIVETRHPHARIKAIGVIHPGGARGDERTLLQILNEQLRHTILQPVVLPIAGYIFEKENRQAPAI